MCYDCHVMKDLGYIGIRQQTHYYWYELGISKEGYEYVIAVQNKTLQIRTEEVDETS